MRQALYRKYRPRTFDDVCGQEHITSILRYEVAENALSHAYLFCGSRGTGKTTCAKILAKAVNCLDPQNGSPCGKCAACLSIENGSATDVLEMDAASNNGVENIRDIRDEVVYSPSALRYRVYIVDEVHMLSGAAFNALLKTLEEPPAHVIFILATTELHKLPATIISRCQRFDFRRIALPVLASRLSYIAGQEGLTLESDAAEAIARMAQGGMRDAISLLELCAGAQKTIDLATVNEMMGSGGRSEVLRVVRAVAAADYNEIFGVIADAVASSRDLSIFWQDLIALYRDLLVVKTTDTAARYLDLTDAETADLSALAATFTRAKLLAHCRLLEEALFAMQKANAVKRMVAELTLVRMCDPALDTSAEGLLSRIERLEDALASGVPAAPVAPVAPVAPAAPAPKAAPAAPADDGKSTLGDGITAAPAAKATPVRPASAPAPVATPATGRVLTRIRGFIGAVERVERENTMLGSFLQSARAFTDSEGHTLIQLESAFAEMMLTPADSRALIARALTAELGKQIAPASIIFEVQDTENNQKDTVLDEILSAAEENERK